MGYIEGVGDDVTVIVTILLTAILIYIAWLSTSVSERPLVRIVVLDRARFQEFLQRFVQRNVPQVGQTNGAGEQAVPRDQNADDGSTSVERSESSKSSATISSEARRHLSQSDTAQSGPADHGPPEHCQDNEVVTAAKTGVAVQLQMNADVHNDGIAEQDETVLNTPHITQTFLDSFLSSTRSDGRNHSEATELMEFHEQQHPVSSVKNDQDARCSFSADGSSQAETSETRRSDEQLRQSGENNNAGTEEALSEGHIRIRLKYLDERQRLVQARPEDTIGQFKRAHFSVELADNFSVRFIFRGQELREECSTLEAYHVEDNSVIHCLLSRISQSEQATNHSQPFNLDLGFLMFPLFGVTLGLLWYCRVVYRSYFNAVSTLMLVGMTFLFLAALLAHWRREERLEHED